MDVDLCGTRALGKPKTDQEGFAFSFIVGSSEAEIEGIFDLNSVGHG